MNANERQQLFGSLEGHITGYINHKNHLCDESFFDISDLEERIAFLNTMYENYKNVDPDLKTMISSYIAAAMLLAEDNLAINKEQINSRQTLLEQFLYEKISTLDVQQQEIICKNYIYYLYDVAGCFLMRGVLGWYCSRKPPNCRSIIVSKMSDLTRGMRI